MQQCWNTHTHAIIHTHIYTDKERKVSPSYVSYHFLSYSDAVVKVIMQNINAPHTDSDANTGIKYTHRVISRKSRLTAEQLATGRGRHLSLSFLEI